MTVRKPAVAGMFYPRNKEELRQTVQTMLKEAEIDWIYDGFPKIIIAPHAGYVYSGPAAAKGYIALSECSDSISRVVILAPSHRWPLTGFALHSAEFFQTPLGNITVDHSLDEELMNLPQVSVLNQSHDQEHSLEVHLPFLQEVLDDFSLIPLVVGDASPSEVAEVLELVWGQENTLIVISTDLSHFENQEEARIQDDKTASAIENFRIEDIHHHDACGRIPLQGLLKVAKDRGMKIERVELCTSGDVSGDYSRVVGYGTWLLFD